MVVFFALIHTKHCILSLSRWGQLLLAATAGLQFFLNCVFAYFCLMQSHLAHWVASPFPSHRYNLGSRWHSGPKNSLRIFGLENVSLEPNKAILPYLAPQDTTWYRAGTNNREVPALQGGLGGRVKRNLPLRILYARPLRHSPTE